MPTMTASTSTLTPDEMTLPSTRSAANAVLPNRPKGISTKPAKRRQLELDQRHKELDRQNEEGEQHHDPGEQQDDDLDEILEEADIAHQGRDRVQDRAAGIDSDLGDAAGTQEVGRGHAGPGGFQAKPGKTLEDDAGEIVPVADQPGEDADEQRLLGEPGDDVLISGPAPEDRRQRDVDGGERRGQERDLAAEQAEAGIDIAL